LVDVAQDVIVREDDCGTSANAPCSTSASAKKSSNRSTHHRSSCGRISKIPKNRVRRSWHAIKDQRRDRQTNYRRGHQDGQDSFGAELSGARRRLRDDAMAAISRPASVDIGEAVGIIAAQSISEPGTQLYAADLPHGGVATEDITGLPRIEKKLRSA
jgi:DNA-directed RNA polymerase subunit beta'